MHSPFERSPGLMVWEPLPPEALSFFLPGPQRQRSSVPKSLDICLEPQVKCPVYALKWRLPSAGLEGKGISHISRTGILNVPRGNRDILMGTGSRATGVSSNSLPGGRYPGGVGRVWVEVKERQAPSRTTLVPSGPASADSLKEQGKAVWLWELTTYVTPSHKHPWLQLRVCKRLKESRSHYSSLHQANVIRGAWPGGPEAKTPCSKRRGPQFHPWSRNWHLCHN